MTVAFDSNLYLYVLDKGESVKRARALRSLREVRAGGERCILLWQVAAELLAQLRSWAYQGRVSPKAPRGFLSHLVKVCPVITPSVKVLDLALDLGERYSLSHWDSMLLAACVDAGVTRLYTEDMGAPRKIDAIELINPLLA